MDTYEYLKTRCMRCGYERHNHGQAKCDGFVEKHAVCDTCGVSVSDTRKPQFCERPRVPSQGCHTWVNTRPDVAPLLERVSRGPYRHYKGGFYFVIGVGILDEDGHADPNAPRQVIYESRQSAKSGLINLRSEAAFIEPIEWPDGVVRPRFVRIEED